MINLKWLERYGVSLAMIGALLVAIGQPVGGYILMACSCIPLAYVLIKNALGWMFIQQLIFLAINIVGLVNYTR